MSSQLEEIITIPATNLALSATATASSQDTSTGQTADKAIDGVVGGYPGTPYNVEWATTGGGAGSWLKLTWASKQTFNTIVLYDRPNSADQITGGNIQFSDGSSVTVGALPNDGSAYTLSFPAKTATWLQLNITSVSASTCNVGLAEIQVTTNLALSATATASSQDTSTGQTADKAIDGVVGGYPGTPYNVEWATTGGVAGSWLKLTWASKQTFNTIVLYDRPNSADQITGGNIQFSDGSSVDVGALPNDGSAYTLSFADKTATWLQLNITSVSASTCNVGLAEIQIYTIQAAGALATLSAPQPQQVFYVGTDGHVYQLWYHDQWAMKTDLTGVANAPAAMPGSALATLNSAPDNPQEQQVFYIGTDQHVHVLWYNNPTGWTTTDLTAITGAPVAVPGSALATLDSAPDRPVEQQVFYIGADYSIHQLWYDTPTGWTTTNLTVAATGEAVALDSGLATLSAPQQQVFYVSKVQHVNQLWYDNGWRNSDLTAQAAPNAPLAAAGSGLATLSTPQQQVFYIGTDQHVHVLWYNNPWTDTDLTALTKAPAAAAGSALATLSGTEANPQEQQVVYIDTDQHVHELFYGGPWNHADLSVLAATTKGLQGRISPSVGPIVAAMAGSGLAMLNFPVSLPNVPPDPPTIVPQPRIFYVGTDGHVHQLWCIRWSPVNEFIAGWWQTDLSQGSGSTPVPLNLLIGDVTALASIVDLAQAMADAAPGVSEYAQALAEAFCPVEDE